MGIVRKHRLDSGQVIVKPQVDGYRIEQFRRRLWRTFDMHAIFGSGPGDDSYRWQAAHDPPAPAQSQPHVRAPRDASQHVSRSPLAKGQP